MFMAAVDQTLLATATPAIAATLGGLRDTSWIAVGYLLASATIVPVYGRLGDRRGRRDLLLVALGVFTVGSIACGFAQSLPQLVAARVLQGLGGGGLMVLSQALIGELVPPRERARFQGYFATVFTAASIGGPVLGGIVVSHVSWRWLFFANLPLGHRVSAQYAGFLLLPVTGGMVTAAMISAQTLRRTGRPRWIPVIGMSCSALALFLIGILPSHMGLLIALGFLCGLGFGCVLPTIQVTVQTVAGRERLGVLTALN